ncbi:MAG: RpiB/LacA/LacB family sugar-phosphate isomerase, partial [Pseudomonadota bacterium]|nr:RpiB/LacA/LacB family sugar-phosphate isomerase [Pseudomonadota bacterium]
MKRIYLASDHAGTLLKDQICEQLAKTGYEVKDLGANGSESVDYPDFAKKLAKSVAKSKKNRGILVCGSGVGMSIVANKVKNIRAA